MLPIVLSEEQVQHLFEVVEASPGYQLTIDLENQTLKLADGTSYTFDITAFRKYCMLNGFDDIGLTLRHADKIKAFEQQRLQQQPWLQKVIN